MMKTIPKAVQTTHQLNTGVTLPINLVHQTIAYLETRSNPMAAMLREDYKSWLEMSVHHLKQQKVARTYELYK